MNEPLITMCLIVKDEKPRIWKCFQRWWHLVDEVVVCDTGSTDGTLGEALKFAKRQGQPEKLKTTTHKWDDDFAAARNKAESLATGTWVTWCDLDDRIDGFEALRQMAADATDDVVAFFCHYDYARDEHGNCMSELWRERVCRRGVAEWEGRLHEHKQFTQGHIVKVDPSIAQWFHERDQTDPPTERNLRVLNKWIEDEPDNPRVLSSIAMEYMGAQDAVKSAEYFYRYLDCPGEPVDRRAQSARILSTMLMIQGKIDDAHQVALRSLNELWTWPETHLTLAEIAQTQGRPGEAYLHAETALRIGKPDTLLILNPLQLEIHPRAVMAVCAAQQGRFEDALTMAEEVLRVCPTYGLITANVGLWQRELRKQRTISAFIACAQLLEEGGELVKAQRLLKCVPHYAIDEPPIIAQRGHVARRCAEQLAATPAEDPGALAFALRHMHAAPAGDDAVLVTEGEELAA